MQRLGLLPSIQRRPAGFPPIQGVVEDDARLHVQTFLHSRTVPRAARGGDVLFDRRRDVDSPSFGQDARDQASDRFRDREDDMAGRGRIVVGVVLVHGAAFVEDEEAVGMGVVEPGLEVQSLGRGAGRADLESIEGRPFFTCLERCRGLVTFAHFVGGEDLVHIRKGPDVVRW